MSLTLRNAFQKVRRLFGGDNTVGWFEAVTIVDADGNSMSVTVTPIPPLAATQEVVTTGAQFVVISAGNMPGTVAVTADHIYGAQIKSQYANYRYYNPTTLLTDAFTLQTSVAMQNNSVIFIPVLGASRIRVNFTSNSNPANELYVGTTNYDIRVGGTQSIAGIRSNAGTDLAAGQRHVTVGGSDGTNLRPLRLRTDGGVFVDQTRGTTAAITSVAASATTVAILAASTTRTGVRIFNESSAIMFLAYAPTASLVSYTVQIPAGAYWESPPQDAGLQLSAIWSAATGNARITAVS